ncbi:hypothetical protein [Urechidicola croceus]|uniref:Anti-sigma factor n=1 Tax=Urechidicola croceus TaxID=1850246 RepID=A0A1D8P3R7_9FLAO|nr:hypothetical protein [Urechidicola croceus]AOW19213.1 hypothetical protein LPB138_00270 [Urechidicola croceus]
MNDNFDKLFDKDFDIVEPTIGHFERFQKRVENQPEKYNPNSWKWLIMVASIALIFGIWFGQNQSNNKLELADISPKMEETQDYFTSAIRVEIEKINAQKTPENSLLIEDAFQRLNKLEKQYSKLTFELKESEEDQRVIYAMISNFQQRIEVLKNLVNQLENIKQLKTTNYEMSI